MREFRRKQIKDRVFRKADLLNLSAVILDEFQIAKNSAEDRKEEFRGELSFFVSCDDDTSYQSETPDFWREGGIGDIKRIRSITMRLRCYLLDRSIEVSLGQGRSLSSDVITVDGSDHNWVNGVFNRLMEILSAVPPQQKSIRKLTTLMFLPAIVGYTLVFWFVLAFVIACAAIYASDNKTISQIPEVYADLVGKSYWWFFIGFGLFFAASTKDWVLSMWPEIEFDFGPDHMNMVKQRRNRILVLWAVVLVPMLVTVTYEVTKAILFRK